TRSDNTMKLAELTLRTVRLPLIRPYVLSYRTFTEFEPIIVEARDADGRIGWGEGHISPGSSSETREGGWAFCREQAAAVVGKDANDDARRVKAVQRAIAGRATMRVDANRAYNEIDACRFAAGLDPAGIELFEQPCRAEDWEANAKVASVSPVPIMLDEPICELADVKRASAIANVGFCKLKLKRFGGLDLLREALDAIHEWGMEAVLGDGLSSELGCWMEACIARVTIRNAGEFNGFLKPNVRLFSEPLRFVAGELVLPSGFTPTIDA